MFDHFKITDKINELANKRKHWQPVMDELQGRLDTENKELSSLKAQHANACLLAETGDASALGDIGRLDNKIQEVEKRISTLQASVNAAQSTENQSKIIQKSEADKKNRAMLNTLLRDLKKESDNLDKSMQRVSTQYNKVADITAQLNALTKEFKVIKYGDLQLAELINKPLMNFVSCLSSRLPPNTGLPKSAFHEDAMAMADLVADFDHIKQFLILDEVH